MVLLIAERSEASNHVLWAQQSQLAFIHTTIYYNFARPWPPGASHVFKMAFLAVFLGAVFEFVTDK